jgi:hypothetical protein
MAQNKKSVSKFAELFKTAAEEPTPLPGEEEQIGRMEHIEEPSTPASLPVQALRPEMYQPVDQVVRKPMGRPPGKRSDPSWKQFSVLLQKDTHKRAANILRDRDDGQDLSDLVQILLEDWIKKQQG